MKSPRQEIFKSYDIRGVFPGELDGETARRIGRAGPVLFPGGPIGVSRDMRVSAPVVKEALIEGLLAADLDVVDLGVLSTCMFYFAVGAYRYAGGIQVTASHNPPEYIGMKFVSRGSLPIAYDNGLNRLAERVQTVPSTSPPSPSPGKRTGRDTVAADYRRHIRDLIGEMNSIPIVVDCGDGMAGLEFPDVFDGLPPRVDLINRVPDGAFPHHGPNPLKEENRKELIERVQSSRAEAGFVFDGDADRTVIVDETGTFIPNDLITALLAGYYLKTHPGASIIADFRSGWAAEEYIRERGGTLIRCRVGHSYIKERMRQVNAVFGGDIAGHYYFRDNYFSESSSLTVAKMLELLTAEAKSLSELCRPLRRYFSTGEIDYTVPDKAAAVRNVAREFKDDCDKPDYLDGVTIRCPNYWLNVRPSNTEPVVRFMAEAKDRERLDEIRGRVEKAIRFNPIYL